MFISRNESKKKKAKREVEETKVEGKSEDAMPEDKDGKVTTDKAERDSELNPNSGRSEEI